MIVKPRIGVHHTRSDISLKSASLRLSQGDHDLLVPGHWRLVDPNYWRSLHNDQWVSLRLYQAGRGWTISLYTDQHGLLEVARGTLPEMQLILRRIQEDVEPWLLAARL